MTTVTAQTPGPDGETTQLAAGLTDEQAQAHVSREPEPEPICEPEPDTEREPEPEPDAEPEPGERPEKIRALAIPDLRPYADAKAAVGLARRGMAASRKPAASIGRRVLTALAAGLRLIWSGSVTLLGLLLGWLAGTYGTKPSIPARLAIGLGALLAVVHTVGEFPTQGATGVVCLWCVAAIAAGRGAFDKLLGKGKKKAQKAPAKDGEKAPAQDVAKDDGDAPALRRKGLARWGRRTAEQAPAEDADGTPGEDVDEDLDEPPLTALIRELTGDDNGVHLSTLRPAMRQRLPGLSGATDKQLRQVLVDAGYDPSRTFRARGVAGRAGVHRDELPPLPSPGDGQEAESDGSSPPESGPDLRKSPHSPPPESRPERGRKARSQAPEGWTEEDVARGYRWVNDASRGPSAWVIEHRQDAG